MEIAPNRKALTHERILDTAARVIRRAGFQGVGVADIMKEAGLTHGGFYAHFASRGALVEGYLSERHLSGTENGCAVAALASEMPRQSPDVRAAAAQRVRGLIELVNASLPNGVDVAQAPAIASQMVGALQLARALGDNAEGKALLAANRSALLAHFDTPSTH
jgi:TetR/AcrR family transcriptional regulator, transcriptional repressor for nem operon